MYEYFFGCALMHHFFIKYFFGRSATPQVFFLVFPPPPLGGTVSNERLQLPFFLKKTLDMLANKDVKTYYIDRENFFYPVMYGVLVSLCNYWRPGVGIHSLTVLLPELQLSHSG